MKFNAQIEVFDQKPERLVMAFAAELRNPKRDRSNYTLSKTKRGVIFKIEAEDSVALRATLDSIMKLLIVYEKMNDISSGKNQY